VAGAGDEPVTRYDRLMAELLTSIEPLREAFARKPFGLISDVDGTLSPMAAYPADALVTPRNLQLLSLLSRLAIVAVVTGRDLPDLRRMLPIPGLIYAGLHGLAWQMDGREFLLPEAEPFRALTVEAAKQLEHLAAIEGVFIEVKTAGLAYHYRHSPDLAAARAAILSAIAAAPAASAFQVHEGILVVELRPPIVSNKGLAVRRLAKDFSLQGLIFLGDDITDIDGFLEAERLRQAGEAAAYAVAVAHAEAPSKAAEAADFVVRDISGSEWLLGAIVAELGPGGAMSEIGVDVPAKDG
jgi:trehalose 6-phosphate phosphatase